MTVQIRFLTLIRLTPAIAGIGLTLGAPPGLAQESVEPSAQPTDSSQLGGPITPSTNPFQVKTQEPIVSPILEDPTAKRFIIKQEDNLTVELSRFNPNTSPPPAPFFDEQRGKNLGVRFLRLKADEL